MSDGATKELELLLERNRPLHVAIVVDVGREQERVATVYERYPCEWTTGFRREALMRCSTCRNGDLRAERRHKSAEKDGRVAVVIDIPVTVCPSCETAWYDEDVAVALDAMLTEMLAADNLAVRQFRRPATTAA
jgi:YgiT-type zinc finger domain-containing protein